MQNKNRQNRTKPKLFLDFDECLVSTMKAFCTTYNQKYGIRKGFVTANYRKVKEYDFSDQCTLLKRKDQVHDIFDSKDFFFNLELKKDSLELLNKYREVFDYHIVTIGTPQNLSYKALWIKENLPLISNIALLSNSSNKMDKSLIDMGEKDGVRNMFIDDHQDNLFSSNADYKVCISTYGKKNWNKDWDGISVNNWKEFDGIIQSYYSDRI